MFTLNIVILLLCIITYTIHHYIGNIFTIIVVTMLFIFTLIIYTKKYKQIKKSEQEITILCNNNIKKFEKKQWEKTATILEKHYKIKIKRNDKDFQATIKALIRQLEKENKDEHEELMKKF